MENTSVGLLIEKDFGMGTEGEEMKLGAWGTGIFDNDDALDVRYIFQKYLRKGWTIEQVTDICMDNFPGALNHVNFVLALAALQMEQKQLMPEIRQRALQMIEERHGIASWREPDKRIQVLEQFKQKLLRY